MRVNGFANQNCGRHSVAGGWYHIPIWARVFLLGYFPSGHTAQKMDIEKYFGEIFETAKSHAYVFGQAVAIFLSIGLAHIFGFTFLLPDGIRLIWGGSASLSLLGMFAVFFTLSAILSRILILAIHPTLRVALYLSLIARYASSRRNFSHSLSEKVMLSSPVTKRNNLPEHISALTYSLNKWSIRLINKRMVRAHVVGMFVTQRIQPKGGSFLNRHEAVVFFGFTTIILMWTDSPIWIDGSLFFRV